MLSALLRPFQGSSRSRIDDDHADLADLEQHATSRPSLTEYRNHPHATADFTEADDDDDESNDGNPQSRFPRSRRPGDDDNGFGRSSGLLPLFSDHHLDSIPIYSTTHQIRLLVQSRAETTLTWEQLKSPQVSQFLIKPMQQQIRAQYFSPGTVYCLMANCLQFEKESHLYPGNASTNATRAKVCELLAIKLLREYSTRELIDALCYEFWPLQGCPGSQTPLSFSGGSRSMNVDLRSSTLEIAIRASAKHFLSHPLVMQQIEAIWSGAISFHPSLREVQRQSSHSSGQSRRQSTVRTPLLADQPPKEDFIRLRTLDPTHRSAVLYDPRTASPFKLSRLRVPRYRRLFSTGSLVVLICLYLAVLGQRSSKITGLELLFWFWSAGFMLDEIVGFSEHGVSFYVMSFWNIFDLGSLLLLIVYYCMRIYGVFLLDPHQWNQNAYDVLALNAILLLPRIFSVLDHSKYFSQLLIAFRLLALDLAAVFLLCLVCCSGFFVFFIFSKGRKDPWDHAYSIFQILVGYTPAAWEMWPSYGWLGKALMGLFLIVGHFVILTILVTVLANSFMNIASKTNQEYQFLFAINAISMVKNDALFSYVAPGNLFAWLLMPLRYFMPVDQYVWLNRMVIKVTHFPLLFCIYFYEKYILAADMYEATDLVDKPRHNRASTVHDLVSRSAFFSPSIRVREDSVFGYQKDRVLDEVFRRAPDVRTQRRNERRKTQNNAIRTWMDQQEAGGYTSPHRNYSTMDRVVSTGWERRFSMSRERPSRMHRIYSDMRSAASDPAEFISDAPYPTASEVSKEDGSAARRDYATDTKEVTDGDADGDDELVTNDEDEEDMVTTNNNDETGTAQEHAVETESEYFTTPVNQRSGNLEPSSLDSPRPPTSRRVPLHTRTLSSNTILFMGEEDVKQQQQGHSDSSASGWPAPPSRPVNRPMRSNTLGDGRRSPRRALYLSQQRPRSMVYTGSSGPVFDLSRTAPNRPGLTLDTNITNTTSPSYYSYTSHYSSRHGHYDYHSYHARPLPRRKSLADLIPSPESVIHAPLGNVPSDYTNAGSGGSGGSRGMSSKMMWAKMKSLEASLGGIAREMRSLRKSVPNTAHNSGEEEDGLRRGAFIDEEELEEGLVAGGGSGGGSVSGSGGDRRRRYHWRHQQYHQERQQQQQQQRLPFPGSDPSSTASVVGGSGAFIEVAREKDRDRERMGGLRRSRTLPKRIHHHHTSSQYLSQQQQQQQAGPCPSSATGVSSGRRSSVFRSPRSAAGSSTTTPSTAINTAAASGLGIAASSSSRKGKEKEVGGPDPVDEMAPLLPPPAMATTTEDESEDVSEGHAVSPGDTSMLGSSARGKRTRRRRRGSVASL